jgi:D-amino peptidase
VKILVSVDMEGVADITSAVQCRRENPEFAQSCNLMTREALAACEGAARGGATEITVNDAHGDMRNIDHEMLPEAVELVRGNVKPLAMVQGVDRDVAGVVFVGYHAPATTVGGILDHTYWGTQVHRMMLNGEICGEARMNAAVAGAFGAPIIFISGDQSACADAVRFMPWVRTVAVKQALGRTSAISMSPQRACAAISDKAAEAVADIKQGAFQPYIVAPPLTLDITLMTSEKADVACIIPGVQRIDGGTVRYVSDDIMTIFKASMSIMRIASTT